MSYILEAIRKSEQERQDTDHVPDLNAVHESWASEAAPQKTYWLWLVLAMAAVIVILLALQFRSGLTGEPHAQTAVQPTTVTSAPAPAQTAPTTTVPAAKPAEPLPMPATMSTAMPATTPASLAAVQPGDTNTASQQAPMNTTDTPAVNTDPVRNDIQALYRQQQNQTQLDTLNAPATLKNLPQSHQIDELNRVLAQRDTAPQAAAPQPAAKAYPSVYEIPESVSQQIPSLKFGAHIYSETTDSGFTIINGRKYLPVSEISPGLELIGIKPNNVILRFRGYEFSVPAMRDWVKP